VSGIADLIVGLRAPATLTMLVAPRWTALLSVAKAEVLLGTLAEKAAGLDLPPVIAALLAAQRQATEVAHTKALWEAEQARVALAPLGIAPILLKGTAYVAAGLQAGQGRQIGDLDILVPCDRLDDVEAALLAAGWQWLKADPYDDAYYRRWMHELPPLIHREREAMIDVHHTILPLTHRAQPDAQAMVADAVTLQSGLRILSRDDMILHCAAHCIADGELDGGLRNLWDMHCLLAGTTDWDALGRRAGQHQLWPQVGRAMRLSHHLYGTPIPAAWQRLRAGDRLFLRRLTARDDWGRPTRRLTRLIFTMRGHAMRMPPLMLARHLWTKWRRR
jgi:hypothetical protein